MTTVQKKVLIHTSSLRMLINFRLDLLKEMLKNGNAVYVTGSASNETDLKIIHNLGIEYFKTSINKDSFSIIADIKYLFELFGITKRIKPDVIFGITHKPSVYGSLAGYFSRSKLFSLLTGLGYAFSEEKSFKRRVANVLLNTLYRICLKRNTAIIFQNIEDCNQFKNHGIMPKFLNSYVVNGSGVNLNYYRYRPLKIRPIKFLMMARLISEKGVREYLSAASIVKQKYPDVEFHLLGAIDTNPRSVTISELLNSEVKNILHYHTEVKDVRELISECSIFVLPSYYREGVPHSILEAMSIGRPIITCDSIGCRETILRRKSVKNSNKVIVGKNGLLVPPRDAIALAKAMEFLIVRPDRIKAMGRASLEYARHRYDVKNVNESMLGILELNEDNNKKKLLINSSSFRMLLNFRMPLLRFMIGKGYVIYATGGSIFERDKHLCEVNGIHYISTDLDRAGISFLKDIGYLRQLISTVIRVKPDLILNITHKPIVYGSMAGVLSNARVYSSIEGLGYAFSNEKRLKRILVGFTLKMLYRFSLRYMAGIIFQNSDDLMLFQNEKIITKNVQTYLVNGTGVDLDYYHYTAMPKGKIHFLLVARMISEKGVADYVEAARIVKRKYPDMIYDLVGPLDPNPKSIKMDQILDWQKKNYVTYHGEIMDVRKIMKKTSVMVLPSYYREGIPRTLMEALSTGRPIITTDSVGCRETVMRKKYGKPDTDGIEEVQNGYLVPKKNPQALAMAMIRLIEDRGMMQRMARKSREYATKRFDVEKVNRQMLKILGDCAQK